MGFATETPYQSPMEVFFQPYAINSDPATVWSFAELRDLLAMKIVPKHVRKQPCGSYRECNQLTEVMVGSQTPPNNDRLLLRMTRNGLNLLVVSSFPHILR